MVAVYVAACTVGVETEAGVEVGVGNAVGKACVAVAGAIVAIGLVGGVVAVVP